MARHIKLQDTGEIVSKDKQGIYQAPDKKYYSSEDAFLEKDMENHNRENCIVKMYDFMGYSEKQKLSTFFYKRLSEWHEGYKYSVIYSAMQMSADSIQYADKTKSFNSETGKLNYFMAIIQNKLNDAQKVAIHLKQKVKQAARNNDLDAMIDGLEVLQNVRQVSNKKTNIESLVGNLDG